jgi:pyridoxal phosphate enzyme (YggS family)
MSVNVSAYHDLMQKVGAHDARLIAVSKTKPKEDIMALYNLGHRDFGENRVAELVEKHAALPKDIRWHFIGHLQRNKVRDIAPFVHLIHAVDSLRLLKEIDKRARANDRVISALLQFHVAEEDSKYGLQPEKIETFFQELLAEPTPSVDLAGVMGMATYTDDTAQVNSEFKLLADTYSTLKKDHFSGKESFREISMGMSGDYPLALAQGSTLVRVGSLLFGGRE